MAISQYIALAVFVGLFGLVLFNFVRIVVMQRRYKTLPLLAFYILGFFVTGLRLYTIIFLVKDLFLSHHYADIAQPISKLQIGLVQAWIMVELVIRIDQSVV